MVFLDIERYSTRRTLNQLDVIDAMTACVAEALEGVGKQYLAYAQKNNLNFKTDIISIPTGDGAAVVFSFDGLHDIHLAFAKRLLEAAWNRRQGTQCEIFDREGWCNCHPYFNLRVGISEGKGIVFTDVNENYNCAGGVMNLASRAMGLGDRNQIIFTEAGYRQIIDMITDPTFIKNFVEFKDVSIKHGEKINVYQYVGTGEPFLNSAPPEDLILRDRLLKSMKEMRGLGLPIPDEKGPFNSLDKKEMVQFIERMSGVLGGLQKVDDVTSNPTRVQRKRNERSEKE